MPILEILTTYHNQTYAKRTLTLPGKGKQLAESLFFFINREHALLQSRPNPEQWEVVCRITPTTIHDHDAFRRTMHEMYMEDLQKNPLQEVTIFDRAVAFSHFGI